jgi:hypothetical protein
MDLLLSGLDMALANVSREAIERASFNYMTGKVKDQSLTFPPSIPEFVKEAENAERQIGYERMPKLPPPVYDPERIVSPEEQERVQRGMLMLGKALKRGALACAELGKAGLGTPEFYELEKKWSE